MRLLLSILSVLFSVTIFGQFNSTFSAKIQSPTRNVVIATDVKTIERVDLIALYPNPCHDYIGLLTDTPYPSDSSIRIFNANSDLVISKNNFDFSSIIDVSFLKTGVYFVQINGDQQFEILKFIKLG